MNFDEKTLFSENIKNSRKTMEKIQKNKGFKNLYIVAFREDSSKPEIYPTLQFKQKHLSSDGLHVIGVFKEEGEALELIRILAEIASGIDDSFDFKAAFEKYREESL